jgi:hypothetical protein
VSEQKLVDQFKSYVLEGKTIKELQQLYGWSRTKVTEFKKLHGLVGLSPNSKKLDRSTGTKTCNACCLELPLSSFYSNGKTSAGVVKYKPTCIPCENSSRKSSFVDLIETYLSIKGQTYSCIRCGYTGIFGSLDFHHRNPAEKSFNIGATKSISEEAFLERLVPELDKCDLLCPNCHRQEHLLMGLKGFD